MLFGKLCYPHLLHGLSGYPHVLLPVFPGVGQIGEPPVEHHAACRDVGHVLSLGQVSNLSGQFCPRDTIYRNTVYPDVSGAHGQESQQRAQ